MTQLATTKFRIFNANQFKENFGETDGENMYVFIGYPKPWANNAAPPSVTENVKSIDYDFWRTMIAGKKIISSDVSLVVPRYNWTTDMVYREYSSTSTTLNSSPVSSNSFYVLTDQFNVYKCLFNNNGANSTVKPTGQALTTLATVDGYKWKFMYNISAAEEYKFLTPEYMPIKSLSADDGSPQWQVMQNTANGSIDVIDVVSGGSLYLFNQGNVVTANTTTLKLAATANTSNGIYVGSSVYIKEGKGQTQLRQITGYDGTNLRLTVNTAFTITPNTQSRYVISPTVTINGDGLVASAYSNCVSGEVKYVNIITKGLSYSTANVTITANSSYGSGAVADPFLSPVNGHGSAVVPELNAYNVLLSTQILLADGVFPANNDFHTIGLLKGPLLANNLAANIASYSQTSNLVVTSASGTFPQDGFITGSTSTANASILLFSNTNLASTEGVLRILDEDGVFTSGETITANNGTTAIISSINTGMLKKFSGELMYIENVPAVQRASDQIEDIKIIFRF